MLKLEKERNAGAKPLINLQNRIANNHVGADGPVRPNSRGITLVALVITIIVMLILVGVTLKVAIDGGLIGKAKEAAKGTEMQADRETLLEGALASLDTVSSKIKTAQNLKNNLPNGWEVTGEDGGPYTATSPNGNKFIVDEDGNVTVEGEEPPSSLPEGWTEVAKPEGWDNDKVIAVTDGTNTIPLPDGYEISNDPEENTIEKGVVIKDSKGNEFVWIPVKKELSVAYSGGSDYLEPTELTYVNGTSGYPMDSQAEIDGCYGEGYYYYPEIEEEKSNAEIDFAYKGHYAEMVESVNKYNGFYIGRYETTIDENNEIGSVANTTVLSADKSIPQTNNKKCRWYGLYYTQRNSNVAGNKDYIQTNMICGQQWDMMLEFFDSKSISYAEWGNSTQGREVKSAESTNASGEKDEIYNIYDLRTNCYEWTTEANGTSIRLLHGGVYDKNCSASYRYNASPGTFDSDCSSRLTLYIK